ncbi:MAG: AAA family ATPase, partial [Bernardetiaceae bacterium]|nr:AAA family ATPase [Bernardetiaceae bacterium]
MGKCPACGSWNTFVEEILQKDEGNRGQWRTAGGATTVARPKALAEIDFTEQPRYVTPDRELNRALGGGIVPGSIVLIGGEPGIGKSTLMLQIATTMPDLRVLYVSGEESEQQIKMRAERLVTESPGTAPALPNPACFILTETNTQNIFKQIEAVEPNLVVIDSIQTLATAHIESAAGSVSQVRETAAELLRFAKESGTPVFLIGHITKEGTLAGPKVLEHMVDTVLQFEGDRHLSYRILRTIKNRFGSTAEMGIYEMRATGLRQVSNPSEILLSQRE